MSNVKKRVYFLGGFDPRGAAYYHRLFREEARKGAKLSGVQITTGKRNSLSKLVNQWQVESVWGERKFSIDYRFLNWDDLIRQYWVRNTWLLIFKAIPMYCSHVKSGLFKKFRMAGKGPYLFSIYPLLFISIATASILLAAMLVYFLVQPLFNNVLLSVVLAIGVASVITKFADKMGEKMGVWWVLQSFVFTSLWAEKPLADVEQRNDDFADQIIQDQLASPVDEILLIGHCSGTMMSVEVMDKIISRQQESLKDKLTFITLGQIIPYLSYVTTATHFHKSLQNVANDNTYPWFDMGARADPLCFQQVNPAIAKGVCLNNTNRPCRIIVKPYDMFTADKYMALKKNKLRLHFQYLMAADIQTDYDYFEIVTGSALQLNQYKSKLLG